ncbi:DNA mismatch repair protein MutT [Pelobium manganitolerans]|uniref:DNA mismatch repair protein MutT n=1 Tax=Pelobium manganitolerans TaxID=1842495 RepID=A0A419S2D9_9SPHI|nr:NUDIX hydrolase [Pelobium manganitolerans]RKD12890.1 DNA mismatch repair protein MutT [Pelobium manganitolerans]
MSQTSKYIRPLVAVDCLIFGFENQTLKVLLIKRKLQPYQNEWSLMGGFLKDKESADEAASRVLKELTGLEGIFMEQIATFSKFDRDPAERTISIVYSSLIDISKFEAQLNHAYEAHWFKVDEIPALIFDHEEMVAVGRDYLKKKAALQPILFELLGEKFTIPQIQQLYEEVFESSFDKRNFSRKLLGSKLLHKLNEKDKSGSKKGAFYYELDKQTNHYNFNTLLTLAYSQL